MANHQKIRLSKDSQWNGRPRRRYIVACTCGEVRMSGWSASSVFGRFDEHAVPANLADDLRALKQENNHHQETRP